MHSPHVVEMEATAIQEKGCYMHLPTGLLIRVTEDDITSLRKLLEDDRYGRVVRLSSSPNAPVSILRQTASSNDYPVGF